MSKVQVTCRVIGEGRSGEDVSVWVHRKEGGRVMMTVGPKQDDVVTLSIDELQEALELCRELTHTVYGGE